jgi:hypothetical protein
VRRCGPPRFAASATAMRSAVPRVHPSCCVPPGAVLLLTAPASAMRSAVPRVHPSCCVPPGAVLLLTAPASAMQARRFADPVGRALVAVAAGCFLFGWPLSLLVYVPNPLFKFRNNAQLAAQLAASISHVALTGR